MKKQKVYNMADDDKTRKLISDYLAKGYSRKVIEKSFIKAGYSKKRIKQLLEEGGRKKFALPVNLRLPGRNLYYAVGGGIVIILIIMFFLGNSNDCKADMVCFKAKADKCQHVKGYVFLEGNQISLEADRCTLTKWISEFDPVEPLEIVELLQDKDMICEYNKGEFDDAFLNLTGSLDKCDGSLKDILIEIRLSQLELES